MCEQKFTKLTYKKISLLIQSLVSFHRYSRTVRIETRISLSATHSPMENHDLKPVTVTAVTCGTAQQDFLVLMGKKSLGDKSFPIVQCREVSPVAIGWT